MQMEEGRGRRKRTPWCSAAALAVGPARQDGGKDATDVEVEVLRRHFACVGGAGVHRGGRRGEVVVVDSVGEAEQQLGELQSGVGALLEESERLDLVAGEARC